MSAMGGWMELDPRVGTETRDQSDAVLIVNTESWEAKCAMLLISVNSDSLLFKLISYKSQSNEKLSHLNFANYAP